MKTYGSQSKLPTTSVTPMNVQDHTLEKKMMAKSHSILPNPHSRQLNKDRNVELKSKCPRIPHCIKKR